MNMSNKESFTLNGVGLPFHVQGLPEPLAWIGLFHASLFLFYGENILLPDRIQCNG